MGKDIVKAAFDESEYRLFRERLEESLALLGEDIRQPGYGVGPVTIGAELELSLVYGEGRPLPYDEAIRADIGDSRITLELNRFNLELNASPVPLAGRGWVGAVHDPVDSSAQLAGGQLGRVGQHLPLDLAQ